MNVTEKFSHSSMSHPCPVCGRTKDGDCRITADSVFCHTHQHIRPGETLKGHDGQTWACVSKTAKGAGWGIFKLHQPRQWVKPARPKQETYYQYPGRDGKPLVRVKRIDDGQGRKRFIQERWDGHRWVAGLGDLNRRLIPVYRYTDVRRAIELGNGPKLDGKPLVVWVEGEKTADALWEVGIPATTSIGGSQGFTSYGEYYHDLEGAVLVIAPDRDQKGLEYARQVAAAFNGNVKGWVYAGDKAHWQDPSDGYDLADWIAELRQQGLDDTAIRQFILGAIGQKREIAVPVSSRGDGETEVTHELVGQLLAQTQARFDIHKLVHPTLAKAISSKAQSFNLPPEILLSVFLVVASSLVPHKLQLGEDYLIPGLLWLGLVGDSGTGKSPVLDLFTSPLQNLQLEAFESYKQELKEWENTEDRDEDLKPKRRFYYISDLTWEAIKKAMEARSHCLVYSDELAGFVNGLGQYKPRAGNDRQRWLTAYNGGSIDILRVDESHHIPSVHLSILGGIQPSVLHKLIKSDGEVVDGFWARFMWVEMPHRKVPCPLDMPKSNLLSVLESVYQVLDRRASVSTTFELDAKGKQVWRQWWDEIETLKDDELNPFIRALYPKLLERAGRIALVAHCVNCAVANTPPGETIPVETLKWAIAFTRWTLQQARAVYGDCGYAESPEAQRVARFVQRFQGKQVNGRRVVTWWTGGKKPSAKDARNWLANLVNLGYAQPVKGTPDQPDYTVLVLGTSGTSQVQNRPNADYDDVPAGTSSGTSPGTSQVHPVHAPWEILDDVPGNVPDVPGNVPDAGTPESLYLSGFPEIVPDVPDVPDDVPEEQPPTLTKEEILERFPLGSLVLAPRQSRPLPVVGVVSTFNLLKLQQPNGEPWYVHWVDAKLVKE